MDNIEILECLECSQRRRENCKFCNGDDACEVRYRKAVKAAADFFRKSVSLSPDTNFDCPSCKSELVYGQNCDKCGQLIDWENLNIELTLGQLEKCSRCSRKDGNCSLCNGSSDKCGIISREVKIFLNRKETKNGND